MIIINLSCSGYMIEINGEQISVVGLTQKYSKVRKQHILNTHNTNTSMSNKNVQWFNTTMEKLSLITDKKTHKYSAEKQKDEETKCCLHSRLLHFALQDASCFHVLNPHLCSCLFRSFSSSQLSYLCGWTL